VTKRALLSSHCQGNSWTRQRNKNGKTVRFLRNQEEKDLGWACKTQRTGRFTKLEWLE
jgi:hypothetical protein